MIFQALLAFILLNLTNNCYAYSDKINNISYDALFKAIQNHEIVIHDNEYNPSKTAAIVNQEMSLPIYINFKTKKIYKITGHWPGLISTIWLNDSIAHIQGSCGTGCAKSIIFIAPSITVSCSTHEYRIENLNPHYPPDFQHNRPLLIDIKKEIYVCYDDADNIQVFPLPKHPTIHPPKGYHSEKAEIKQGQLFIIYENGHGKVRRVSYGSM